MSIIHVKDKADFEAHLANAGNKLVVVDFFATWCGPCRQITPFLEKLAKDNASTLILLKVDVDENEALAGEMGISAMPTFKLFKQKKVVAELTGANQGKLEELVNKHK